MPERAVTQKPLVTAGTVFNSGDVNTGQNMNSLGGSKTATRMSGVVGPDVNLWVGGGRLDLGMVHSAVVADIPAASGVPIVFYDSAVAVSGGPLNASGHKIVGVLGVNVTASGVRYGGQVFQIGIPFTSGLCVSVASGQVGWTASFTPAVSG